MVAVLWSNRSFPNHPSGSPFLGVPTNLYVQVHANVSEISVIVGEMCTGFAYQYRLSQLSVGMGRLNLDFSTPSNTFVQFGSTSIPVVNKSNVISAANTSHVNFIQSLVFGNGPGDDASAFRSNVVSPLVDAFNGSRIQTAFPYVFASVQSIVPGLFVNQSVSWTSSLAAYDVSSVLVQHTLYYNSARHVYVIGTLPTRGTLYMNGVPIQVPNTVLPYGLGLVYVPQNAKQFSGVDASSIASLNTPPLDTFTFFVRDTLRSYPNRADSLTTATANVYVVDSPSPPSVQNVTLTSVPRTTNTIVAVAVTDPDDSDTSYPNPGSILSPSRLLNGTKLISSVAIQLVNSPTLQNFGVLYMCDCATLVPQGTWLPITSFCDATQFTFCYIPRSSGPLNPSVLRGSDVFSFFVRDPTLLVSTTTGQVSITLVNPLTITSNLITETVKSTSVPLGFIGADSYSGRQLRFRVTSLPSHGHLLKANGNSVLMGDEFPTGGDGKTILANSLQYVPNTGYFNFVRYGGSATSGWPFTLGTDPFLSAVFRSGTYIPIPRQSFADMSSNRVFSNLLNQPIDGCVGQSTPSTCRCSAGTSPGCPDTFTVVLVAYVSGTVVSDTSDVYTASMYVQALPTGNLYLSPSSSQTPTPTSLKSASQATTCSNYTTFFLRNNLNPLSVPFTISDPDDNVFAVSLNLNPNPGKLAVTLPPTTTLSSTSNGMFPYQLIDDGNKLVSTCYENGCDVPYRLLVIPVHISQYIFPKMKFYAPIATFLPDTGSCLSITVSKPLPYGVVDQSKPSTSSRSFSSVSYALTLDPSASGSSSSSTSQTFIILISVGVLVALCVGVMGFYLLVNHIRQREQEVADAIAADQIYATDAEQGPKSEGEEGPKKDVKPPTSSTIPKKKKMEPESHSSSHSEHEPVEV